MRPKVNPPIARDAATALVKAFFVMLIVFSSYTRFHYVYTDNITNEYEKEMRRG